MGQPTKLTIERHEAIVESVRLGNYYETAARATGISDRSFYFWMERGEADEDAGKDTIYSRFFQSVTCARGEAEANAVKVLADAAPEDWRAAAHYLERAHPGKWGRRDRLEHSGKVDIDLASVEQLMDTSLAADA